MMLKCHCRDCQQVTGGGFAAAVLVPAGRGQLRYHFTPRLGGERHKRGFCPECGSRITGGESGERPTGFVGINGQPGRPELVSSVDGYFRFGRATVGSNGSRNSEIRAVSMINKRIK
jgi:hypothetical protein